MTDLQPLGDQAVLLYFAQEQSALHYATALRAQAPLWLVDVVQAYAGVAVFFDVDQIELDEVMQKLRELNQQLAQSVTPSSADLGKLHVIPCCYEMELDLARIAERAKLPPEDVIDLHLSSTYVVYAIGFCPGFPYLGYLPEKISGVPRLESPRVRLDVGSVALTGRQTGIYTEPRPGGWNVLGRTPLELVNVVQGYFPLRTGDQVRFERIDEQEFRQLEGERIT